MRREGRNAVGPCGIRDARLSSVLCECRVSDCVRVECARRHGGVPAGYMRLGERQELHCTAGALHLRLA